MPHIPADNLTALGAVLFGLAWLGFWADRHPIARKVSGVPWVLTAALILSNSGVIPLESPAYGFVGQYILPMGIPMLLFKANMRSLFREGGRILPAFLIACVGLCIGAASGFYIFDLGPEGAKIAGTYAGGFIGGVTDFVAISQAVQMTPTTFSVALSASAPAAIFGLLVLVSLPTIPFVRRWLPSKIIEETGEGGNTVLPDEELPRLRVAHITAAITISLAICAVSSWICNRYGLGNYNLFGVTLITVLLVNLAPKQFAKLEGDFTLGMLCMYVFFAMIGAGTDAIVFLKSAPILFVYCSYMLAVQFVVVIALSRLLKLDLAEVIIGSGAAIVGAAAAAGIASAKGWKSLITAGITIGILGKVIANFIGIALVRWLGG